MPAPSHQKIGNAAYRKREAKRLIRDRKIYAFLREKVAFAEKLHWLAGEAIDRDQYSLYTGKDGYKPIQGQPPSLTPFPVPAQSSGRPMPRWSDLSQWMKIQVVAMAYVREFQTFNIRIHPLLEAQWVPGGVPLHDVRAKMVERIRKQLDTEFGRGREWFFVMEGWSKETKAPTYLHIHGGAAIRDVGDGDRIVAAVGRAAGHGLKDNPTVARALHGALFSVEQAAYANYLLKSARRHDPRLAHRRLAMSDSMTSTARLFWETITRAPADWREPIE